MIFAVSSKLLRSVYVVFTLLFLRSNCLPQTLTLLDSSDNGFATTNNTIDLTVTDPDNNDPIDLPDIDVSDITGPPPKPPPPTNLRPFVSSSKRDVTRQWKYDGDQTVQYTSSGQEIVPVTVDALELSEFLREAMADASQKYSSNAPTNGGYFKYTNRSISLVAIANGPALDPETLYTWLDFRSTASLILTETLPVKPSGNVLTWEGNMIDRNGGDRIVDFILTYGFLEQVIDAPVPLQHLRDAIPEASATNTGSGGGGRRLAKRVDGTGKRYTLLGTNMSLYAKRSAAKLAWGAMANLVDIAKNQLYAGEGFSDNRQQWTANDPVALQYFSNAVFQVRAEGNQHLTPTTIGYIIRVLKKIRDKDQWARLTMTGKALFGEIIDDETRAVVARWTFGDFLANQAPCAVEQAAQVLFQNPSGGFGLATPCDLKYRQ